MASIEQRLAQLVNPLAAMIFFAPEATDSYGADGLNWFEGYFCSRSAAFGRAAPEVVVSTFFNFFPGAVRRAVEGGWSKTTADKIADQRFQASGKAMRRLLAEEDGSEPDVKRANELLWRMVDSSPPQGRPLYAAHLSEPRRDDPFEGLWQAANLLREFRGDGHIAILVAEDLSPVEALILHASMMGMPRENLMRGPREWPQEDVAAGQNSLAAKGFVDGETVTAEGIAYRKRIEDQTDVAARAPIRALGAEAEEVVHLLTPLTQRVNERSRR
jgi:hypothetical protein